MGRKHQPGRQSARFNWSLLQQRFWWMENFIVWQRAISCRHHLWDLEHVQFRRRTSSKRVVHVEWKHHDNIDIYDIFNVRSFKWCFQDRFILGDRCFGACDNFVLNSGLDVQKLWSLNIFFASGSHLSWSSFSEVQFHPGFHKVISSFFAVMATTNGASVQTPLFCCHTTQK